MENTVVGVYDSYAQAQNAMNELLAHGFSRSNVQMTPNAEEDKRADSGGSGIGHFFRSLFGMEEHHEDRDIYSEAVRRGGILVTVDTESDDDRERAVEILSRFYPADIDERAAHWRSQGWSGYDENAPMLTDSEIEKDRSLYGQATAAAAATENEKRIPVAEEELRVGKREVQRGGVRVYQRVQEKPVHDSVQLREEHVKVERHPVDQPASEADMGAFKEGSVEVREMAEEPVVSKAAHLVEEIIVGKEVTQGQADVNDTVRRTDVEIEQLGAAASHAGGDYADTRATADDADFRSHWQSAYGRSGGRYEDYDAAYRYGTAVAGTKGYQNYRWEDAEPQIRRDWESRHPESTWDKVKDAVRYGVERARH